MKISTVSTRRALLAWAMASTAAYAAQPKPTTKGVAALASLSKTVDKVEGINWYYDKTTRHISNQNSVHLYIGEQAGRLWLRMKFQFTDEDWLFVQKATVVVDGKKFAELTGDWERDNKSVIWEWLDISVDKSQFVLATAIANAKNVVVRYEGRKYYKDRTVTAREIKAIGNVLAAFKDAGGTV